MMSLNMVFFRDVPVRLLLCVSSLNGEGISVSRLSRLSKVHKPAVSRIVHKFESLGLVRVIRGSYFSDIYITSKGEAVVVHILGLQNLELIK